MMVSAAARRITRRPCSVNGAVRTRPWTRICRNSRQVPPTGSSTPRVSLPGAVAWPVIREAPSRLEQLGAPAAHTWVWK